MKDQCLETTYLKLQAESTNEKGSPPIPDLEVIPPGIPNGIGYAKPCGWSILGSSSTDTSMENCKGTQVLLYVKKKTNTHTKTMPEESVHAKSLTTEDNLIASKYYSFTRILPNNSELYK